MGRDPKSVGPDQLVEEAERVLRERKVDQLAVVEDRWKLRARWKSQAEVWEITLHDLALAPFGTDGEPVPPTDPDYPVHYDRLLEQLFERFGPLWGF